MKKQLKHLALICGGPSLERGISLNSTRSVLDHLSPLVEKISIYYVSPRSEFYLLNTAQLYSNTPMDFDFKLLHLASPLSETAFVEHLQKSDLVFPLIHGTYGEDGQIQAFLEKHTIPFVGPQSHTCDKMYHKPKAKKELELLGFPTWSALEIREDDQNKMQKISDFFQEYAIDRAVVKPAAGGSSIGVSSVMTAQDAYQKALQIFSNKICDLVLIEPFCRGQEFTLIILQTLDKKAVALVPSEIKIDYAENQLFDYRKKYLPTANTHWLCPPTFSEELIEKIRQRGEQIFSHFGMQDFARLDGWVLETGDILFTDFNPISGMEQNSFIFQQAAWMGLTHQELLCYLLTSACNRQGLTFSPNTLKAHNKKPVAVLFGGSSAERQVSLMSGSNVWLKLKHSKTYQPIPYFLDPKGTVWRLPHAYALSHTVEEIYEKCQAATQKNRKIEPFQGKIRQLLGLEPKPLDLPVACSLDEFCLLAKQSFAFVFIGLHGGMGENGVLQDLFDRHGLVYNGSGPEGSAICMDKNQTAQLLNQAKIPQVRSLPKILIDFQTPCHQLWQEACAASPGHTCFIIKPQMDGCSAGIVLLKNEQDLVKYLDLIRSEALYIPAHTFSDQPNEIEFPDKSALQLMLEPYIETDRIAIKDQTLYRTQNSGWLELTIGVLEKNQTYHALNPSITVASQSVLSLEEKFQGGTGVNLTPPPEAFISAQQCEQIKRACEQVAATLLVKNYCRIDLFYHPTQSELIIIEANSLPALTPSTVIFHQALAETVPLYPLEFLERLIENKRA